MYDGLTARYTFPCPASGEVRVRVSSFRTFERLNRDDARPGTGVGLALCKRIVERHGGRIWVESAASQGATIHFSIPWGGERGGRGGSDASD